MHLLYLFFILLMFFKITDFHKYFNPYSDILVIKIFATKAQLCLHIFTHEAIVFKTMFLEENL